jgi:hypothetical protein
MSTDTIRRYIVMGSRRVSNYWWATVRFRGLGFINGLSSYLQFDLLPVIHSQNIVFFPQGLVMCFMDFRAFI